MASVQNRPLLAQLEGRRVHFLVLLSSCRWNKHYEQIRERLKWAQPTTNITRWAGHGATFQSSVTPAHSAVDAQLPPNRGPPLISMLHSLEGLKFELVPVRKPALPAQIVPVAQAMHKPTASVMAASALKPVSVSREQQVFKLIHPSVDVKALFDVHEELHWPIPAHDPIKDEHWRLIDDCAYVAAHRRTGESLLVFHLLTMDAKLAENLKMNDSLMGVVRKYKLQAHIDSLYPNNPEKKNNETYANYIEALCYKLLTCKKGRRVFLSFMEAIVNA